jgi:hypothetical protein
MTYPRPSYTPKPQAKTSSTERPRVSVNYTAVAFYAVCTFWTVVILALMIL